MILQFLNFLFQLVPPQDLSEPTFHNKLCKHADDVYNDAYPCQNQYNSEYLACISQLVNFTVPDCRERDDGHIEGVSKIPPFYDHISYGAGNDNGEKDQDTNHGFFPLGHVLLPDDVAVHGLKGEVIPSPFLRIVLLTLRPPRKNLPDRRAGLQIRP